MEINEKIKELFDQENNKELILQEKFQTKSEAGHIVNGGIVYDGVVNKEKFGGVVFFLKEATVTGAKRYGADTWDITETAKEEAEEQDGKKPIKWDTICYWMEAFKNPAGRFMNAKKSGGNLAEVAFVNLKKTAGEQNSKNAPLDIIAEDSRYAELIKKEVKLIIGTKLVVCGGTYEYAKTIYGLPKAGGDVTLDCGAKYFKNDDGVIFLEFIHPTQYGTAAKPNFSFAFAKEVFSELKTVETLEA